MCFVLVCFVLCCTQNKMHTKNNITFCVCFGVFFDEEEEEKEEEQKEVDEEEGQS